MIASAIGLVKKVNLDVIPGIGGGSSNDIAKLPVALTSGIQKIESAIGSDEISQAHWIGMSLSAIT